MLRYIGPYVFGIGIYVLLPCTFGDIELQVRFGSVTGLVSIEEDELSQIPDWKTDLVEPPLSIGNARNIATQWLDSAMANKKYSEFLKLSKKCRYVVHEISIHTLVDNDWYYKVSFEETPVPPLQWPGGEALIVEVIIDMKGTVRIPEGYAKGNVGSNEK